MPRTDPALEAAMALATRRRDIPEPLSEIYVAWNLCFRAYCLRYDQPWPSHRVVPAFISYLREKTTATRPELVHAIDAVIFGLEETTGLAGPIKTALRARLRAELPRAQHPAAKSTPAKSTPANAEPAPASPGGDGSFHHQEAALTRVMVAIDEEKFTQHRRRT